VLKFLNKIWFWLSKSLSYFFAFPDNWDEEKKRKAKLTTLLFLFFNFFLAIILLIRFVYDFFVIQEHHAESLLVLSVFSLSFLYFLFSIKAKGAKAASIFLISSLLFLCLKASSVWGLEIYTVDIIYPMIIFLAAMMLSAKYAFLVFFIEAISLSLIFYFNQVSLINIDNSWKNYDATYLDLIIVLVMFLLTAAFSWVSTKEIESSLKKALKEEKKNKKLLKKLKYQNQNLERIVEERTAALKDYQLKQLIHISPFVEMGKLTTGIIHNIRTPLSVISLVLDNLENSSNLNEKEKENLLKASTAVSTINDFSRVSKNQFSNKSDLDVFSLSEEIEKLVQLFNYEAKKKGIKIFFNSSNNYKLLASKQKLTQVLANLLMNAVESFENSDKKDKNIFIKLKRNKHYLVIEVKDYGSGISDANLKKLFSPRFTTKMENQGLGLGLYFCQETMEDYFDSRIAVASKLGEGSTFSLRIKNKFILGKNGRTKRNRKIG